MLWHIISGADFRRAQYQFLTLIDIYFLITLYIYNLTYQFGLFPAFFPVDMGQHIDDSQLVHCFPFAFYSEKALP